MSFMFFVYYTLFSVFAIFVTLVFKIPSERLSYSNQTWSTTNSLLQFHLLFQRPTCPFYPIINFMFSNHSKNNLTIKCALCIKIKNGVQLILTSQNLYFVYNIVFTSSIIVTPVQIPKATSTMAPTTRNSASPGILKLSTGQTSSDPIILILTVQVETVSFNNKLFNSLFAPILAPTLGQSLKESNFYQPIYYFHSLVESQGLDCCI